ncbi:uncharacterized protein LOC122262228 [Penaeus japonicus]|uniref:uncharacterized protein LOC122262228 n=1 Tax=Penaeus japonicus TaxID=27405 RepID=UPI001C713AD2|nr:uncharacterized protein LOC122262228 [Penaeus japonicus]
MADQPSQPPMGASSPPPRPPSPSKSPAGQEKHGQALDFPGVRFADENATTKPQQETQVVIESLRDNRVQDERTLDLPPDEVVEVDWLGVPLARSTLPDFVSMYRQHYPGHDPRTAFVQDPRKIVRTSKPRGRPLYEQFEGVGWVPRDTVPEGQVGGYVKMGGEVGRALLHPQGDQWNTPTPIVTRVRKNDPMEYFNLIDPQNKISVERGMYQWLVRDQAAMDESATVGPSARTSGFTANSSPHLPPAEERDFRSVYFQR